MCEFGLERVEGGLIEDAGDDRLDAGDDDNADEGDDIVAGDEGDDDEEDAEDVETGRL